MKEEFTKILQEAIIEGLSALNTVLLNNNRIPTYSEWYCVNYDKNGFPNIHNDVFKPHPKYSDIFTYKSYDGSQLINTDQLVAINKYKSFCKYKCDSLGTFLPKNFYDEDRQSIIDLFSMDILTSLVERYYELYNTCEYDSNKFDVIANPVLNRLFAPKLLINFYIPILFTKFLKDKYDINDNTSIIKMDDKFHRSRAGIKLYSSAVTNKVLSSATHALVLKDWSIENHNTFNLTQIFNNINYYPMGLINNFFGSIRVLRGINTGFCQLLVFPVDWADNYKGDLISLQGTSCRKYPSLFDNYYWNNDEFPVLNDNDIEEICSVYNSLINIQENKIGLAINRINRCFLREDYEDSILDATIALESLLIDDGNQEMTYKLAMRIAYLSKHFPNFKKNAQDVFKDIKNIYTMRSKIVHGKHEKDFNNIYSEKKELNSSDTEQSIDYLRKILLVLIKNQKYLRDKNIDLEMLQIQKDVLH